jgi:RNA polymerase sigma-70 factor (ECF subfamily)
MTIRRRNVRPEQKITLHKRNFLELPVSNEMSEEEFLEQHAQLVYNVALRLVGNPVDAEDLAQDALIRALKSLNSFRGDASPKTWVYRITVNTWKNRVRSEKRRSFWKSLPLHLFSGDDEEEREAPLAADDPPLDAGLESDETSKAVQKALLELDEESRSVIVLREIERLSYDDISLALNLPIGTVKSRISRARATLKEKLKSHVQTE